MILRVLIMLYAVFAYAAFLVSVAYAIGFVGNFALPKTIDVGGKASLVEALSVDAALLCLFAIQHSVMARPGFKRRWTRIIPQAAERSTYVLLSSLILLSLFWQWRPIPVEVWRTEGAAATVLQFLQMAGWLIAFTSTFLIDHFDLFGLRQGFYPSSSAGNAAPKFQMPFLYRIVRHPIMLGFLIAFWAAPVMTAGHLLFAGLSTGYILFALQFEERDLVAAFGKTYEYYQRRVPMLLPFTGKGESGFAKGADNMPSR